MNRQAKRLIISIAALAAALMLQPGEASARRDGCTACIQTCSFGSSQEAEQFCQTHCSIATAQWQCVTNLQECQSTGGNAVNCWARVE